MQEIKPLFITASSLVSPLGIGRDKTFDNLIAEKTGLSNDGFDGLGFDTWLGQVKQVEQVSLEPHLAHYNCRNNRLAKLGLDTDGFREAVLDLRQRYGASRIGVFVGTSTSGVQETELAYTQRDPANGQLPAQFDVSATHNIASLLQYVKASLGLTGVGNAISTACSSSAKVFASAHRYIQAGLCDAAIVGGVDTLCLMTLYGFNSLQLVSPNLCQPWDQQRCGINIGEGAGFAILETQAKGVVKLKGYGESSDAYHMSTPHPEGVGAVMAMRTALQRAGLDSNNIDYINLHGTATPSNDRAEAQGLYTLFGDKILCSSTKGYTGHTLGAAGITEAIISMLALEHNTLPRNLNLSSPDPDLPVPVIDSTLSRPIEHVMTNSFGFGGSNCSLILGW